MQKSAIAKGAPLRYFSKSGDEKVRDRQVLVGLIGAGIQLSRTPTLHETEARRQGVDLKYDLIDLDLMGPTDLAQLIAQKRDQGYAGLNVTYPCKIEALSLMDVLSESARAVGAINTIVFKEGKAFGHNTDCWGFATSFRAKMAHVAKDRVLLVGAGGAGAAVGHALADCGVSELFIHDVEPDRAIALTSRIMQNSPNIKVSAVKTVAAGIAAGIDGLVNATPMGMAKLTGSPVPRRMLDAQLWVADIIYFPLETKLLKEAGQVGCTLLSGSGMAVFQAVRAFSLFTGLTPDVVEMVKTFESFG